MCVCIIRNWLTQLWRLTNPQICSWRLRIADGIAPVHILRTKIQGSQYSPNAIRLESQEKPVCFRQNQCPSSKQSGRRSSSLFLGESAICFYLVLQLIGWDPFTWGRVIYFTQFVDSNTNFIQKYLHRLFQNNVWLNVWVSHGPGKLAQKTNHHKSILCQPP